MTSSTRRRSVLSSPERPTKISWRQRSSVRSWRQRSPVLCCTCFRRDFSKSSVRFSSNCVILAIGARHQGYKLIPSFNPGAPSFSEQHRCTAVCRLHSVPAHRSAVVHSESSCHPPTAGAGWRLFQSPIILFGAARDVTTRDPSEFEATVPYEAVPL